MGIGSAPGEAPLRVNARVVIPRAELSVQASRSGGPGGQHVNTSSSRIEVRWNIRASAALAPDDVARLVAKLGSRISTDGTLRVTASESRSQRRNRDLAEARLVELVRRALVVPKPRRRTKRPRGAEEARLQEKRERAHRKGARRWKADD
jgi:ribosome-associated protein